MGSSGPVGRIDIDTRGADHTITKRIGQRLLIDDLATGGVDDHDGGFLEQSDVAGVQIVVRLLVRGDVEGDNVRFAQQRFEVDRRDIEFNEPFRRDARVVADQIDFEPAQPGGDDAADPTEADFRIESCPAGRPASFSASSPPWFRRSRTEAGG